MFAAFRNAALVGITGLAASLCGAPARADIIFDFSGTCTLGCSGTATGVFDLTNTYSFGSPITSSTFVSFSYSSSDASFTIPASGALTFTGGLDASGSITPAGGQLGIFNLGAGIFQLDSTTNIFAVADIDLATSLGFTLVPQTVAPEPASLTLLAMGLAGLGVALRTRRA